MRRPRLLDLYCGAGGASMGYHQAGFEVVGVDIRPQSRYPFAFVQADALEYVAAHGHEFDVIHASPPCQAYTRLRSLVEGKTGRKRDYPDLVAPTREALRDTGKIYVIENVAGAPLQNPIMLCGEMFGLRVFRHRYFETNVFLLAPSHPRHPRGSTTNAYHARSGFANGATHIGVYGDAYILADGKAAMDIDWMVRRELNQAIPPAYTRWLGEQLIAHYFPEYDYADQSQRLSRQLG